jgi:hypothetical protein
MIPIARTFPLEQWREAMEISLRGRASGKLLLLPTVPPSPRTSDAAQREGMRAERK